MISYSELKKGVKIVFEEEPHEVVDAQFIKMAQRRPVMQTTLRNLITGTVRKVTFQQGDMLEEVELERVSLKFLYSHRGVYYFCLPDNPSQRFSFNEEQIGKSAGFLKPNTIVEGLVFKEKIINILLPIKIQLKVKETGPGIKGDRSKSGTKTAILETGIEMQVPLFIEPGDIIEVNTESGEYVKRIDSSLNS